MGHWTYVRKSHQRGVPYFFFFFFCSALHVSSVAQLVLGAKLLLNCRVNKNCARSACMQITHRFNKLCSRLPPISLTGVFLFDGSFIFLPTFRVAFSLLSGMCPAHHLIGTRSTVFICAARGMWFFHVHIGRAAV